MGPHPAVAAIRLAVRRVLHDVLLDYPPPPPATRTTHPARPVPPAARPATPAPQRAAPRPHQAPPAVPTAPAARSPLSAAASAPPAARASVPAPGRPDPGQRPLVLVACSGGADSMALASALAFEAPKIGVRAGAVTVDHGLQPGSDLRAAEVAERLRLLGLDPVESIAVTVGRDGGPEAAARDARYAALDSAAERHGAAAVLLGHTRDDQAETVLLGLARGSGTRSLSGMAQVSGVDGRYRRPFLQLDRQTARRACLAQSLPVWDDPHNVDPAYTRSRVRHEALPVLEKALGKGVVEALARTAQLSRDDADALDDWAARAEADVRAVASDEGVELDTVRLHALPPAVRRRVLRRAAITAGSPAGSLFARHIEEVDRLITGWRGQRAINLPGRVEVRRQGGRLVIRQG
ncbi:tRNA lysidine(34) synthetase TilS [Streptomyces sp. SAJ15]|uniref:tRNA lysidine(34) synthetase TilS n=1 Tax=Streptomyces sp. SAJ15 TaxID=2011095 RepID=UPI00118507AD|nr:tRNA lysidine(34) synthetase TilS [Streptomyces sp. SAJ15]TVL92151.1 tRNA lysidine(34) synthetase TilS [Streptomyces sp. SAJ15]